MVHRLLNRVTSVLENMLVVEQHLTNHYDIVAQLVQDQHHVIHPDGAVEIGVARGNPPDKAISGAKASDARVSRAEASSDRYRPSTCEDVHHSISDQRTQSIVEMPHENGLEGGFHVRHSVQHESPQPASQESRSHLSDVI
jgi:hypothetical protein